MLVESAQSPEWPQVCRSTETSTCGSIASSTKCASISENVPRGLPGKQRFMSRLSTGDSRVSFITAGMLRAGIMMTRPCTVAGSRVRARRETAICPSYSSPWMPPVNRIVGPVPFFTETIGISTVPQPEVLRDSGARR